LYGLPSTLFLVGNIPSSSDIRAEIGSYQAIGTSFAGGLTWSLGVFVHEEAV